MGAGFTLTCVAYPTSDCTIKTHMVRHRTSRTLDPGSNRLEILSYPARVLARSSNPQPFRHEFSRKLTSTAFPNPLSSRHNRRRSSTKRLIRRGVTVGNRVRRAPHSVWLPGEGRRVALCRLSPQPAREIFQETIESRRVRAL